MNSINNVVDWFNKNYEFETHHSKGSFNHLVDHFKEKASHEKNASSSLTTKRIRLATDSPLVHLMDGQKRLEEIYHQVKIIKQQLLNPKASTKTLHEKLNDLQTACVQIKLDQMKLFFKTHRIPNDKKEQEELQEFMTSLVKTDQIGTQTFSPLVQALKSIQLSDHLFLKNTESYLNYSKNYSLLHQAIEHQQWNFAKYLIENGAELNGIENQQNGNSPLHSVLEKGNLEMAKLLIEKGCDLGIKNKEGKLPLQIVIEKKQKEILPLILKRSPILPLHNAAKTGNLSMIQWLLENGAKLNQRDREGMMPLHHAAMHGRMDVVEFLMHKGAFYNKKDKDGFLPYHLLLFHHPQLAVQFLELKGNIEQENELSQIEEWGDDKMENEFASLMEKCRKPEKTVFEDTDLLIFPDNFPSEKLPLNGIKAKEFEQLLLSYKAICQNKTKFSIEGDSSFQDFVKNDIKHLMTRPMGREIIRILLETPLRKKIILKEGKEGVFYHAKNQKDIAIIELSQQDALIKKEDSRSASGNEILIEMFSFLTLGHELIHALHDVSLTMFPTTLNPNYHNLEEQKTITGIEQPITFVEISPQESQELNTLENLDILFNVNQSSNYSKINENALRSQFGLPYRASHEGFIIPQNTFLEVTDEIISDDVWSFFINLVFKGMKEEIIDFLEINGHIDFLEKKTSTGHSFTEVVYLTILENDLQPALQVLLKCNWYLDISSSNLCHKLAKRHSGKILNYLLEKDKKLNNAKDDSSNNLLHALYDIKNPEGPFVTKTNSMTPKKMNLEELTKVFLKHEVDVNAQNINGDTPLHLAVRNESQLEKVIPLLLEAGAKVNIKNHLGMTPFYEAFKNKSPILLMMLMEKGADYTIVPDGTEPFIFQVLEGDHRMEMLNLLSLYPIDYHVKNKRGQTVLHFIASSILDPKEQKKLLDFFIKKGVSPDAKDVDGKTYQDYMNF